MKSINELETTLKQVLGLHKSRIECLIGIVFGMIKLRTVNLKQLACAISGCTQIDSNYRRLQRFFEQVRLPRQLLAQMIYGIFFYLMKQFISQWTEQTGSGEKRILIFWF